MISWCGRWGFGSLIHPHSPHPHHPIQQTLCFLRLVQWFHSHSLKMEYCSALKRDEILTTWMNLESIMPSEKSQTCVWSVCAWVFSRSLQSVQLFVTPWTVARQAPLSMEFSRQEYWSGDHALIQGIFLTQGLNPCLLRLPHCRQILYCWASGEAPWSVCCCCCCWCC